MTKENKLPKILQKIIKSSDVPEEELVGIYIETYKELTEKGVEGNIERMAINAVRNRLYRAAKRSTFVSRAKAVKYVGVIIGDGGMRDRAEEIRQAAKRYMDKNGVEAAIEENLINADGRVLDTREQVFGKDNPHYLDELSEKLKLRSRILHLIARQETSDDYKYGTIQTNDNALALGWNKIKMFVPCEVYGIVKEDIGYDLSKDEKENMTEDEIKAYEESHRGLGEFKLSSSQAEQTMSIFKASKEHIDVEQLIMETIGKQLTPIKDIEERHEQIKDAWDRIVFVRGIVSWINRDRPTPWGSIWMGLMDEEDQSADVRISVPEWLAIDFGEWSEIIVIGRTRRAKIKDEDGKYVNADVVIDAVGLYPFKGLTTPADIGQEEEEEEVPIEGWLD